MEAPILPTGEVLVWVGAIDSNDSQGERLFPGPNTPTHFLEAHAQPPLGGGGPATQPKLIENP